MRGKVVNKDIINGIRLTYSCYFREDGSQLDNCTKILSAWEKRTTDLLDDYSCKTVNLQPKSHTLTTTCEGRLKKLINGHGID